MRLEPHRLVFLDETGTTTKMTRLRGRCLKGQRLLSQGAVRTLEDADLHRRPAMRRAHRPLRRRRADEPAHLRDLRRDPAGSDPDEGRRRHPGQSCRPQKRRRRAGHSRQRRLAPLPAALQPRPQSDRDGFRKVEGPSARPRHQDHRRPLARHRRNLRSLLPPQSAKTTSTPQATDSLESPTL